MRPHHTRSAGDKASFVFHPSYANPTTITEGTTYTYYVQTTGVSNGTTLYWSITHGTTTNADFSANSGSFTVNNNFGQFSISPTNDNTQDNGETFTLNIRTESISGPVVVTRSITLNDQEPYIVVNASNPTIQEGYGLGVNLTVFNIYAPETIYWEINHITTDSSDFSYNSGSVTVGHSGSSGSQFYGYFLIYTLNQGGNEGSEFFNINFYRHYLGGTFLGQSSNLELIEYDPWIYVGSHVVSDYQDLVCYVAFELYYRPTYTWELEYNVDTGVIREYHSKQLIPTLLANPNGAWIHNDTYSNDGIGNILCSFMEVAPINHVYRVNSDSTFSCSQYIDCCVYSCWTQYGCFPYC